MCHICDAFFDHLFSQLASFATCICVISFPWYLTDVGILTDVSNSIPYAACSRLQPCFSAWPDGMLNLHTIHKHTHTQI